MVLLQTAFSDAVLVQGQAVATDTEVLDLGDMSLTFSELENLIASCPDLARVTAWQTILETDEYESLKAAWPDLEIGCTLHLIAKHYIRTDATVFSTLHGSCGEHSTKQLRGLQYCTNLMALDIGHNALTDISFLEQLPNLRVLILAGNQIRDISVLSKLKNLEYIELFSNDLRDISPLAELPHLIDLNLAYNGNVKSLEPLKALKTLKRLWISRTRGYLDKDLVASLQEALPDTTIMTGGHPTAKGWRDDHPHYQVIYNMFRGDTYIPFEDSYPAE